MSFGFIDTFKKAFETGNDVSTFYVNDQSYTLHVDMNIDEVFEIFSDQLVLSEAQLKIVEQAVENLLQTNIGNAESTNSECFDNLKDELIYEYNLYLESNR